MIARGVRLLLEGDARSVSARVPLCMFPIGSDSNSSLARQVMIAKRAKGAQGG
jgi:hypothetical protein